MKKRRVLQCHWENKPVVGCWLDGLDLSFSGVIKTTVTRCFDGVRSRVWTRTRCHFTRHLWALDAKRVVVNVQYHSLAGPAQLWWGNEMNGWMKMSLDRTLVSIFIYFLGSVLLAALCGVVIDDTHRNERMGPRAAIWPVRLCQLVAGPRKNNKDNFWTFFFLLCFPLPRSMWFSTPSISISYHMVVVSLPHAILFIQFYFKAVFTLFIYQAVFYRWLEWKLF